MPDKDFKPKKTRQTTHSNYDLHKRCVYMDTDFQDEMRSFSEQTIEQYGEYLSFNEDSTRRIDDNGEKLSYVGFSIETPSNKEVPLTEALLDKIFELAKSYCIEPNDISHYLTMERTLPSHAQPTPEKEKRVTIHHDTDGIYLRFETPYVSQADILEIWPDIELQKEVAYDNYSPSRLKANESPELVYGIFKARKQGLTFHQITDIYNKGELMGINAPRQPVGEETLTKLYHRYRPDS